MKIAGKFHKNSELHKSGVSLARAINMPFGYFFNNLRFTLLQISTPLVLLIV